MRRVFTGWIAVLSLAFPGSLAAAPGSRLNFGAALNHAQACPAGRLIVNVTETVMNDVDSGVTAFWAFDDMVRQIQVVQISPDTFCATVKYEGLFTTFGGPSPDGTGTVDPGVRGSFQGGYVATIAGTLRSDAQMRGNLGTFDYECGMDGVCPGRIAWTDQYFEPGYDFEYAWWGWIYHAGNNGTWVNAVGGNKGDITGS